MTSTMSRWPVLYLYGHGLHNSLRKLNSPEKGGGGEQEEGKEKKGM